MVDDADALLTALIRHAGSHPLAWFVVLLLALLGAVGALWWLLRRYARPLEDSRWPPAAWLLLHFALGFALLVGAAALFAEIAEAIGAEHRLGRLDQAFSAAIRGSVSRPTLQVFAWLTRLGDTATLTGLGVAVAALLLWRRRLWLALGWATAVAGNSLLNVTLKAVFERVRPVHDDGLVASAAGWSFPSGHSSGSVVAYGMLAYLALRTLPAAWHLPAALLATTIAFATGSSRVFLQVHYASDVLAGFASGAAWLAVCIASMEAGRRWRRRRRGRA